MEKDKYLMSSLYNALQILDVLHEHEELGVAELNRILGFGKTSIFKMLYTLEKAKYVQKLDNSKYRLGLKFLNYGARILRGQNLVVIARPFMEQLRNKHNETVNLAILSDTHKIVFLDQAQSTSSLMMNSTVGSIKEVYCMASGKMLLSKLDSQTLEECLDSITFQAFTENTITSREELLRALETIRLKGYSEDHEESEIGLYCFSAPILNHRGQCIAAISISGPTARILADREALIASVRATAAEISGMLGYIAG